MPEAPSYQDNDPRGWCGDPSRGAALGRATVHDAKPTATVKLHLRRSYLDSGGYDANGTYFGQGVPLYWYANDERTVDAMTRAYTRQEAKDNIRQAYPTARFYR